MPLIPETWLDSQIVNTTTTGTQTQGRITQLANGNILVSWTSDDDTGAGSPSGLDVLGQLFDPLGVKIGGEIQLNASYFVDDENNADIAALPGGGFVVVYEDNDPTTQSIRLQEFDAAGTLVSADSTVISDSTGSAVPNYRAPVVAVSSATSVLIVYEVETAALVTRVAGKIYDPTTDTYGSEISILNFGDTEEPDVAVLSNGNYVIVARNNTTDDAMYFRIIDSTGSNVLGFTLVTGTASNAGVDFEPSVAALTGGGFVITYTNSDATDNDVNYHVYNAAGVEQASGIITTNSATNNNNEAVVTGLADGSFVIAYDNDVADQGTVAHISSAGTLLGEFVFNGAVTDLAITGLTDGRLAVTYFAGGSDVLMEILDTRDAPNSPSVYAPVSQIIGTIGDDVFAAEAQRSYGHDGNDTMTDGSGLGSMFGGAGNDTIIIAAADTTELADGGANIDTLVGTNMSIGTHYDLINGQVTDGGQVQTVLNFENVTGSELDERFTGSSVANTLIGNAGNDILDGGNGADLIFGGADNDSMTGGSGTDTLSGGSGVDSLDGGIGIDRLIGGNSGDTYIVDDAGDLISEVAAQGADRVLARVSYVLAAAADVETLQTISAGGTTEINLTGNAIAQKLFGNAGVNRLDGGAGAADTLTGLGGNDSYIIRNAASVIVEGVGQGTADRVLAATSFTLAADDNIETLQTISTGAVTALNLTGNALSQSLFGNNGANRIDGRAGQDTLTGNAGADQFVFSTALAPSNVDRVADFAAGVDEILLAGGVFTGIGTGGLLASRFHAGASGQAINATVRIIYETDNGNLWYDADGNGAGARVLFGNLLGAPGGITANDFTVF